MKLVGFIKEHDHKLGNTFKDVVEKSLKEYDPEAIINYLEKGSLLFGWMGYFNDLETNEPVSPHAYYTDGTWVWPSYFPYYLGKYRSITFDNEFLHYLEARNFQFVKEHDIEEKILLFERQLHEKM